MLHSKTSETKEEILVLNEPTVLYQQSNISNEPISSDKYTDLLDKLLQLANKQIEEGDFITHEQFMAERQLKRKLKL